jgi:hypothetical protein
LRGILVVRNRQRRSPPCPGRPRCDGLAGRGDHAAAEPESRLAHSGRGGARRRRAASRSVRARTRHAGESRGGRAHVGRRVWVRNRWRQPAAGGSCVARVPAGAVRRDRLHLARRHRRPCGRRPRGRTQ